MTINRQAITVDSNNMAHSNPQFNTMRSIDRKSRCKITHNKFACMLMHCFILLTAPNISHSTSDAPLYQTHTSIHKAAIDYMQTHIQQRYALPATITSGKLDSRLRLKQCDEPLHAFLPKGSRDIGKTTIGVRCQGTKAWSLHVPVRVSMYKNIAVSAKLLNRGQLLQKSDIKLKNIDLSTLPHGYIDDLNQLVGQKLKRRLSPGTAFTPSVVEKPERIKRGQRVTILARSGSMEVRMTGKALAGGAIGDRIRVMNIKSKKKREGIITKNGEIKVDL